MNSILDHFARKSSSFRPKTTTDLFGLRISQKLKDGAAAVHYAQLASQYSEHDMLSALRSTLLSGDGNLGRRFQIELRRVSSDTGFGGLKLAALRIERRAVAVAIFSGDHLTYSQTRQLSSVRDSAVGSAIGFVQWIIEQFEPNSAAIESIPTGLEIQRGAISTAVKATLRDAMLPIWEVAKADLFAGWGFPPLKSRREVRDAVLGIWPVLSGNNGKIFIQDAAALGIHVQMESRFLN